MEKSIIYIHPMDTITTSTDGKLYKKVDGEWVEIKNTLYKSEKKYPSNQGVNGDYYAKYLRKYNHLLYSEDFTQSIWNKDNLTVASEPSVIFPNNACSKIFATQSSTKHSMSYVFSNDVGKYYTFSLYVKPNEFNRLQISLTDYLQNYGYKLNANFDSKTVDMQPFGDVSYVSSNSGQIEEIIITNADKTTFNYFRIWLTVKFDRALRLSANITMLDNNGNEVFEPSDITNGLFINAAQLACNTVPENYVKSEGTFKTSLYFENLYQKINNAWQIIDNSLLYVESENIPNDIGNDGDIAVKSSIIKVEPAIMVGNASTTSIFKRPAGTIHYSTLHKKWYVQTIPGIEYSLEYDVPKSGFKGIAMAISLNQQLYQTYSRYCYPHPSIQKGISNCGGCYNDWSRIHIKR